MLSSVVTLALENKTYELAGKVMSYAIVHRGPLPQFLHPQLYAAIAEGCDATSLTVDDIPDFEVRQKMKIVSAVHTFFEMHPFSFNGMLVELYLERIF